MRIRLNESTLEQDDLDSIITLFQNDQLTMGTHCLEFEKRFAEFLKIKHAIFVNSGSSANLLAFFITTNPFTSKSNVLPVIAPGSEIIVPALTWSTSVWPIIQIGCIPVFVDNDQTTFQMDLNAVESAITPKTRAICVRTFLETQSIF